MRKLFLLFAVLCGLIVVQAQEIDAVKVTQGGTTDWYQFDNDNRIHVSITNGNPVFPEKTYDLNNGNLLTQLVAVPTQVSYIDENGVEQTVDAWEVKSSDNRVTWGKTGETTWYVVTGEDVTLTKGALCDGDVRLILADGAKLTATGEQANHTPGIQVSGEGNSLTIYGQTNQSGQLIANGGPQAAGIGGASGGNGSHITINGGIITATGSGSAAGIGGGSGGNGSYITINGGKVTANSGSEAAGIGGGSNGNGTYITINGGEVTANGNHSAAGIGGGYNGYGRNITINGGTVTATGGDHYGKGIGSYNESDNNNIFISDAYVFYVGESATLTDDDIVDHSSATDLASTLTQRYVKMEGLATPYTRSVTNGQWGTVCLPYASTSFSGADFFKVNHYDATESKLYIEPVTALEAGKPYIFEATAAGTLTINHSATTPIVYNAVGDEHGLYGSLARKTIAYDTEHSYAAIADNAVNIVKSGYSVTVPACRAYLDMDEVPTTEQPHSAPLRVMGVPRGQATDIGQWNKEQGQKTGKFIRDGQFVIVKDGKMYNALGF